MSNKIKKIYHAAIYVRLSKEDGDVSSAAKAESNSISNQKNLIRDFLKDKKNIEVVSERVDDGYSGSNFDRDRVRPSGMEPPDGGCADGKSPVHRSP